MQPPGWCFCAERLPFTWTEGEAAGCQRVGVDVIVGLSGLCYTAEASFPAPGNAFMVPGPHQPKGGEH